MHSQLQFKPSSRNKTSFCESVFNLRYYVQSIYYLSPSYLYKFRLPGLEFDLRHIFLSCCIVWLLEQIPTSRIRVSVCRIDQASFTFKNLYFPLSVMVEALKQYNTIHPATIQDQLELTYYVLRTDQIILYYKTNFWFPYVIQKTLYDWDVHVFSKGPVANRTI